MMDNILAETIGSLRISPPVSRGPLYLFPLIGDPSAEGGFVLLDDALQSGEVRVEELDEGGSVPELRVINGGTLPVLILEGDELIGAKQNRIVNSSVLVAAESALILPVSCVERGRWSYRSRAFSSGDGSAHPSLRRLKSRAVHDSLRHGRGHRSDQGAVWAEVDRVAYLHDYSSPTDALQDTRTELSGRLRAFEALLWEIPEDARGIVLAFGTQPTLLEVLPGPRALARTFRRLLAGYALEALEHRGGKAPDAEFVQEFVDSIANAPCERHPAVGEGTDVRFETQTLSGYALVHGEDVLHAAAFSS